MRSPCAAGRGWVAATCGGHYHQQWPDHPTRRSAKPHSSSSCVSKANRPLAVFLHNTTGFMVGTDAEQNGIVKHGSKLIQAVANTRLSPKSRSCGGWLLRRGQLCHVRSGSIATLYLCLAKLTHAAVMGGSSSR
jgi:hypothetical protein